jgi:hypothetical protein
VKACVSLVVLQTFSIVTYYHGDDESSSTPCSKRKRQISGDSCCMASWFQLTVAVDGLILCDEICLRRLRCTRAIFDQMDCRVRNLAKTLLP